LDTEGRGVVGQFTLPGEKRIQYGEGLGDRHQNVLIERGVGLTFTSKTTRKGLKGDDDPGFGKNVEENN